MSQKRFKAALRAMEALLTRNDHSYSVAGRPQRENLARISFDMAEAMLEEEERRDAEKASCD